MKFIPTMPKLPSFNTKLGSFPSANTFLPEHPVTQLGTLSVSVMAMYAAHQASQGNTNIVLGALLITLAGQYLYGRHASRAERDGYLFDKPYAVKRTNPEGNVNWQVTKHFKKIEGFEDLLITETRSEQYKILKIKNTEPSKVKKQIPAISMLLGVDERNLKFIQNFKVGTSAILVPLAPKDWLPVSIDEAVLEKGKLIVFVGKSVNGEAMTYDMEIEPHGLIAGDSNSGKTEMIRAILESLRYSGLNPEFHIIDPKEDLEGEANGSFTSDVDEGIAKLHELSDIGDQRKSKYKKAHCKNYFDYQRKVNAREKPIIIVIDEGADLTTQDPMERLGKDEIARHKRAINILFYITRKLRSAGVFVFFAIQHANATSIPTIIRNNLGARIVLSMADSDASKVALSKTGAETLPKFGAVMFKTSLNNAPIIGRGAYIQ